MTKKVELLGQNKRFMFMSCPKCGSRMAFKKRRMLGDIELKLPEQTKRIEVEGMYSLIKTCQNIDCEWSDIQ